MDFVSSVSCKSTLSLLNFGVEEPGFEANTVVVGIALHVEKAIQTTFLHLINLSEIFDAAILCINGPVHFSDSVVSST